MMMTLKTAAVRKIMSHLDPYLSPHKKGPGPEQSRSFNEGEKKDAVVKCKVPRKKSLLSGG